MWHSISKAILKHHVQRSEKVTQSLTWLRLRGCTPFVTTRCERYPVGVMQHPDDCPLTEATGLVLLVLLRMPERFQKLSPFFPLTCHPLRSPAYITKERTGTISVTEPFLQLQFKIWLHKKSSGIFTDLSKCSQTYMKGKSINETENRAKLALSGQQLWNLKLLKTQCR